MERKCCVGKYGNDVENENEHEHEHDNISI